MSTKEEYSALRAELISKNEQKRTVWLHMYLLYLTLFSLGVEFNFYFYLLTFIVLIPFQAVINNLEWTTARISTYIKIFYENNEPMQKWETLNSDYDSYKRYFNRKIHKFSIFVRSLGSIHLGILSFIFYSAKVLANSFNTQSNTIELTPATLVWLFLSIILLMVVFVENLSHKQDDNHEYENIVRKFYDECVAAEKIQREG